MKITGQQPPAAPELNSGKARDAERPKGETSPSLDAPTVSRSRVPLTVRKVRQVIDNTPDVRADRVAQLRERIASGEYRVDSERLADTMLNTALREDLERD